MSEQREGIDMAEELFVRFGLPAALDANANFAAYR